MPQYYNLSLYSDAPSIIAMFSVTDTLMKGMFSLFLILVLGIFITMVRLKKNDEPVNAIMIGSFYSMLLSIILYVANTYYTGINKPGLYVFIPAIVLIATTVIKYYNNR